MLWVYCIFLFTRTFTNILTTQSCLCSVKYTFMYVIIDGISMEIPKWCFVGYSLTPLAILDRYPGNFRSLSRICSHLYNSNYCERHLNLKIGYAHNEHVLYFNYDLGENLVCCRAMMGILLAKELWSHSPQGLGAPQPVSTLQARSRLLVDPG